MPPLFIACAHTPHADDGPQLDGACFLFDKPYFSAVTGFGNAVKNTATATIRLDTESAPPFGASTRSDMLGVTPIPFPVDSFTSRQWRSMSGWRRTASDSVGITWRNGLYGPVFTLKQSGDSLIGTVLHTTDRIVDGKWVTSGPFAARAKRVRCAVG
jgi:hypothetical protein